MKPARARGVEVAATSRGGHGSHPTGRGVTGHAGSLCTILDSAKEREGKDRAPCHPRGSQAGCLSGSASLSLSQPGRISGRIWHGGQERGYSTLTSLAWTPLPPASLLRPEGCGGGAWARVPAPYNPAGSERSSSESQFSLTFWQVWVCGL